MSSQLPQEKYPDTHHDPYSKTLFGFWVYLLTDLVLFGSLFAVYAVLHNNTFGGPTLKSLIDLPYSLYQTLVFLLAAFTIGLAAVFAHRQEKNKALLYLGITFLFGLTYLIMEFSELSHFAQEGASWKISAALSSFFILVATHVLHIIFGLIWILLFMWFIWQSGITDVTLRRITCLKMFWQFLNIIWIFIFSFVYLIGAS